MSIRRRPPVRSAGRPFARPPVVEACEPRRLLATLPTGFTESAVSGALSSATAMAFAPDGRLYVLEQAGTIEVYQGSGTSWTQVAPNNNLLSRASNNANHIGVNASGERGLLGIAFDPDWNTNRHIYIYYTTSTSPIHNRIARFTVNAAGTQVVENSGVNLVELDNLSGATNHNGGAMHFGADGKLYVAVGDNATPANAQSLNNRLGKMLRYNRDGTIPADNPTSIAGIGGTTGGANRAIWAAGLRNPYTFTVHPQTGVLYINDVGQNTWEEVNVGAAGANYGWSATEGRFNPDSFPNYTNPIIAYPHNNTTTPYPDGPNYFGFAITGGVFYAPSNPTFPGDYLGDYFYADYVSDFIRRYDHATQTTAAFATGASGAVDLRIGPDGRLYYLARDAISSAAGRVFRVDFTGSALPYVLEHPSNQTAAVGQTASFSVQAGGPGTLSYRWQRGTQDIPDADGPTYSFTVGPDDAGATFRVRVTNSTGSVFSDSATLTLSANQPPVPSILTPAGGSTFSYGTTVNYSGSATDPEDGPITGASQFSWRVSYFTNVVERPFVPETPGSTSGSFDIPSVSPYTLPDVYFRIYLTVTDSAGESTTTFRDLLPVTAQVTLASTPAGVPLLLDGASQATPHVFTGVAGQTRSLEAPASHVIDGQTYAFQTWSDGGTRVHDIGTPSADTTYTATYRDVTAPTAPSDLFTRERAAPGAPPHVLTFTFSEPVTATNAALLLENLTTGQTVATDDVAVVVDGANKRLRFRFDGFADGVLPDGNYRATLMGGGVTDAAGNTMPSDAVATFRVLAADSNNDGRVNFDDLLVVAKRYNTFSPEFAHGNFNYSIDGRVDFGDLLVLAQRYGTTLAVATPLPAKGAPAKKRPDGDTARSDLLA